GEGVFRELRWLEDCGLSVLAERRRHAPPGRSGGEDGAPGRTLVNGEEQPPKVTRQAHPGARAPGRARGFTGATSSGSGRPAAAVTARRRSDEGAAAHPVPSASARRGP